MKSNRESASLAVVCTSVQHAVGVNGHSGSLFAILQGFGDLPGKVVR